MLTEFMRYYYQAYPPHKREIYRELYEGFRLRQDQIAIHVDPHAITIEEIAEIAISVYNDTPSFYYLDVSQYAYLQTSFGYYYSQKYLYSAQDIASYDAYFEQGWRRFSAAHFRPSMSEYEKEKAIHDYLVSTVTYDDAALVNPNSTREAFNIIGALIKKKAVCHGIACAFKYICDCSQIKSFVVMGETVPNEGDTGHAWNIVKIDGDSYHVDVTWDIKKKGDISFCYDYFNLSDPLIRFDHTWQSDLYPVCNADRHNYYYKHALYVRSTAELTAFVERELRSGKQYIAVKFANKMPDRAYIEESILTGFRNAMQFNAYLYSISDVTHNIYIQLQ